MKSYNAKIVAWLGAFIIFILFKIPRSLPRGAFIIFLIMGIYGQANKQYHFTFEPIDVVIPCHEKDLATLPLVVNAAYKYVMNVRRVIVISEKMLTDKAEWFDEKLFPFDKYSIVMEMFRHNKVKALKFMNRTDRSVGWLYQQFLKLFAMFVVPDISSNVLVIDADTIFLRTVSFQDESGAGLYNPGDEYNKQYFTHGRKVLRDFKRVFPQHSGISHHMLFQRPILEDFMHSIELRRGIEAWRALAKCIDPIEKAGMSEYELYFNFAFAKTDQVKIRELKWCNTTDINIVDVCSREGFDYVSCHNAHDCMK